MESRSHKFLMHGISTAGRQPLQDDCTYPSPLNKYDCLSFKDCDCKKKAIRVRAKFGLDIFSHFLSTLCTQRTDVEFTRPVAVGVIDPTSGLLVTCPIQGHILRHLTRHAQTINRII
jgi:hypothetical protein